MDQQQMDRLRAAGWPETLVVATQREGNYRVKLTTDVLYSFTRAEAPNLKFPQLLGLNVISVKGGNIIPGTGPDYGAGFDIRLGAIVFATEVDGEPEEPAER